MSEARERRLCNSMVDVMKEELKKEKIRLSFIRYLYFR